MTLLLDTNACIALIKAKPPSVRTAFDQSLKRGQHVATSVISAFELWFGVAKSAAPERNSTAVAALLHAIPIIDFGSADAESAGEIRAHLQARGLPIGPYDVLIAGIAVNRRMTLVTSNTNEFRRVRGLQVLNWEEAVEPGT